jgi:hypothetical protein
MFDNEDETSTAAPEPTVEAVKAKARWKKIVDNQDRLFNTITPEAARTATSLEDKLAAHADCIKVQVNHGEVVEGPIKRANEPYGQEILFGKATKPRRRGDKADEPDKILDMLAMDEEKRKQYRLDWNQDKQCFQFKDGKVASTMQHASKAVYEHMAFVQDKEGNLYIAEHSGGAVPFEDTGKYLSHASFLSGKPAEMAGMIKINDQGKIERITDGSGHYRPEALDMYRGIKALEKKYGSDIFSANPEANVAVNWVHQDGKKAIESFSIKDFIQKMENPEHAGDVEPLHTKLRNARIEKLRHTETNLTTQRLAQTLPDAISDACDEDPNIALAGTHRIKKILEKTHDALDLNSPMAGFGSAMHYLAACAGASTELAKLLIKAGANVKCVDESGYTPLHYSANNGNVPLVKCFLEQGVDVHAKAADGETTALDLLIGKAAEMGPEAFAQAAELFIDVYRERGDTEALVDAIKKVTVAQDALLQEEFVSPAESAATTPIITPLEPLSPSASLEQFIGNAENYDPTVRMEMANALLDAYLKRAEKEPANVEYAQELVDAVDKIKGNNIMPSDKFLTIAGEKSELIKAVKAVQKATQEPNDIVGAATSQAAASAKQEVAVR